MPNISTFYGIVISMFFSDHYPPHFHAEYGEFKAKISIETLDILAGKLPQRSLSMVLEWAVLHRKELMDDWNLCKNKERPEKIKPLE